MSGLRWRHVSTLML
jgi:hypothetical protein